MPRSSASNTKRAISATGGKDDSTEPPPKMSKKGARGTNGDEKNLEVVAPSEKKTRAKKGAAAGMEADDDAASLKKKSKKSPVNGEDEADNKPKAKKAALAKHQILTERDEIPKLWNAEEHKDSYSEYLVGYCVDASMRCF